MAGRPKKTETTETIIEANKDSNNKEAANADDTLNEIEELKKENTELKWQLKKIMEKIAVQEEANNIPADSSSKSYKEISPLKLINVVSLSDGGVSLRTAPNGGKVFHFDKFGHMVPISYTDLQDVIATDRTFIEDGSVYICDKEVVRNNYLEETYNRFMTVETINNIFSFPTEQITDMIRNTTETIQESIISNIINKINNNEYVDMNKVDAIGKACATPCDISALALQKRAK